MDFEFNRDILHALVDDFINSIQDKEYDDAVEYRYKIVDLLDNMRNLQKNE